MKRRVWAFLTILLAAALMAGCTSGAGGGNKVKIGLIAPLSGDAKTYGDSVLNGVNLALAEAGNKAGNYEVELISTDDRNNPQEGVSAATKLITSDKVAAIIGPVTSKVVIPVSQVAEEEGVLFITPTGTSPKITVGEDGVRKQFAFRACFIDPFQGTIGARYAANELGAKTAAILYDKGNDYTVGLAEFFQAEFEALGGQIVASEAYAETDTDFNAILTNIASLKPDVLYLPDYYQKVSLIGAQARDKGITAPFIGGDGWDSSDLDYNVMQGGYFTAHYSSDDQRDAVQNFVKAYEAKYGVAPDGFAALGYESAKLVLEAVKQGGNDAKKVRDALQGLKDFPAVSGNITFDENGNPVKAAVILQVEPDQSYKYITTVAP